MKIDVFRRKPGRFFGLFRSVRHLGAVLRRTHVTTCLFLIGGEPNQAGGLSEKVPKKRPDPGFRRKILIDVHVYRPSQARLESI